MVLSYIGKYCLIFLIIVSLIYVLLHQNLLLVQADFKIQALLQCQKKRLLRLRKNCIQLGFQNKSITTYTENELHKITYPIFVDDLHNTMIAANPKTGSGSWKKILIKAILDDIDYPINIAVTPYSKTRMKELVGIYKLHEYNKMAILTKIQNYLSIVTVRNPLTRIESSFRDRIMGGQRNATQDYVMKCFHKYVTSIINGSLKHSQIASYNELAYVCQLPFSFIAKTETSSTDMDYVIRAIFKNKHIEPVRFHKSYQLIQYKEDLNGDKLLPLLSKLNNSIETILKLTDIYKNDMELFGYTYEKRHDGYYATCIEYDNNGMCC